MRRRTARTAAALVGVVLLTAPVSGCDALDAALGDTDGDGESRPVPPGEGTPEDWARLVCGEDAPLVPDEEGHPSCRIVVDDQTHDVSAYVAPADPTDDLYRLRDVNESDAYQTAWGVRQLEDGYGVVVVTALDPVDTATLRPLAEEGFEIDA